MAWARAEKLVGHLGGYGPADLTVITNVARRPDSVPKGLEIVMEGREPPPVSFYAKLPKETRMTRVINIGNFDESIVDSLDRELRRAAGQMRDEPPQDASSV